MPDYLKEYFSKAWDHWLYLMGLLLMVEPLLDYYIAGYQTWASKYVSRQRRTRLAITLSVAALLIVGSLAFKDQYGETKSAQNAVVQSQALAEARRAEIEGVDGKGGLREQITSLQGQLRDTQRELVTAQSTPPREVFKYLPVPPITVSVQTPQRHLSDSQKTALEAAIVPLKDQLKGLSVISEGGESSRYALDFLGVFKKAGVIIPYDSPLIGTSTKDTDRGIMVGFTDSAHPSELGKQFVEAIRSTGLAVHTTGSDIKAPPLDFDLFIAAQ